MDPKRSEVAQRTNLAHWRRRARHSLRAALATAAGAKSSARGAQVGGVGGALKLLSGRRLVVVVVRGPGAAAVVHGRARCRCQRRRAGPGEGGTGGAFWLLAAGREAGDRNTKANCWGGGAPLARPPARPPPPARPGAGLAGHGRRRQFPGAARPGGAGEFRPRCPAVAQHRVGRSQTDAHFKMADRQRQADTLQAAILFYFVSFFRSPSRVRSLAYIPTSSSPYQDSAPT